MSILIYMDIQTTSLYCLYIYIRGIKSSGMLGMVSVETNPSVYIEFSGSLHLIVCKYISGIKTSDAKWMGW